MYSLTIKRNNIRTGKNCASYNRKHPENPIDMRPIYNARRKAPAEWSAIERRFVVPIKIWRAIARLVNRSKPYIADRVNFILNGGTLA